MTPLLMPAVTLGTTMTGVRIHHREYRNKLRTATGKVVAVFATALRLQTEDGFFLVDRLTAKEVKQ